MFEILDEVCTPKRATKYSAYVDLFAREDVVIGAGETKIVPLGVKLDIDMNVIDYYFNKYTSKEQQRVKEEFMSSHYLEVALRSSLAVRGLTISNGIGVIDLDYPKEIGLIVYNTLDKDFNIKAGEKVAQCSIQEHKSYMFGIKSDEIRVGGFGSTNKEEN